MTKVLITERHLQDIAEAIRSKNGGQATYRPGEMPGAIRAIVGGQPVVQPLTVTQNGVYAPPEGVDGFGPVTVNVPGGGSRTLLMRRGQVSTTGNYATARFDDGVDLSRYALFEVMMTRGDASDGSSRVLLPDSFPVTFYIQGANYRYTLLLSANAIQCTYYSGNYVNLYVDVYGYTLAEE